jgi:hypothetical protein
MAGVGGGKGGRGRGRRMNWTTTASTSSSKTSSGSGNGCIVRGDVPVVVLVAQTLCILIVRVERIVPRRYAPVAVLQRGDSSGCR